MHRAWLLILFVMNMSLAAPIPVSIVWPLNPGSNQANYIRTIIAQSNTQQSKYVFTFESRVGGGGQVAVGHTLSARPGAVVLSTPSSFFIRPLYYPNESYNVSDFAPVLIECQDLPYIVVSKKYKSFDELKQQKSLTVGAILGHQTEVVARQLQKLLPNTEIIIVGYNSTSAPTKDVLGGVLDLNIDVPSSAVPWIEGHNLNAIGSTGVANNKLFPTFASQHIRGFEHLTSDYMMLVRADTAPEVIKELHDILFEANKFNYVLYGYDYSIPANLNLNETVEFFNKDHVKWKNLIKNDPAH